MSLSTETTLARVALRQLTANRKVLWVALLALLPVLIAFFTRGETDNPLTVVLVPYQLLLVGVLLPLVSLVVGTGMFGSEIDDGTITYVLGKPVARWRIVLTRILTAAGATAALLVPSTLLTGLAGMEGLDDKGVVLAFTAAVAVGGLLYCAVFVALSLATRRALIAGLIYVVVWEGSLSRLFAGTRALSIREYTLALANALADQGSGINAGLPGRTALIMSVSVCVAATFLAIHRLRRFEIGETA